MVRWVRMLSVARTNANRPVKRAQHIGDDKLQRCQRKCGTVHHAGDGAAMLRRAEGDDAQRPNDDIAARESQSSPGGNPRRTTTGHLQGENGLHCVARAAAATSL